MTSQSVSSNPAGPAVGEEADQVLDVERAERRPRDRRCRSRNPASPMRLMMNALFAAFVARRPLVVEADQEERADADQFPADEHLEQVVRDQQVQHREAEQRQVQEEPAEPPAAGEDGRGRGRDDRVWSGDRRPRGGPVAPATGPAARPRGPRRSPAPRRSCSRARRGRSAMPTTVTIANMIAGQPVDAGSRVAGRSPAWSGDPRRRHAGPNRRARPSGRRSRRAGSPRLRLGFASRYFVSPVIAEHGREEPCAARAA